MSMDLTLTPAQQRFRKELRAWLAENVPRDPEPADEHEAFMRRRRWQGALARAGYVGVDWPTERGGRGLGAVERMIVEEEQARTGAPVIAGLIGVLNIGPAIMAFGTAEQIARHLEPLRTADEVWCQGMSEPGAGSDLAGLRTSAVLDGDAFVVTGQKIWCSWAHEAAWCQLYVRTSDEGSRHAGITCLIVDMRTPGIAVRPIKTMSGETEFCEVFFDGARVPASRVLGELGRGWSVAMITLMNERLGALTLEIIVRRWMDEVLAQAREERVGPVARQRIADAFSRTEILHGLSLRVLHGLQDGRPGPEGSVVKVFASEFMKSLAELGLSLGGSSGMAADGPWVHRFLDARSITIAGGTSEILRNIIGERILGLPKG